LVVEKLNQVLGAPDMGQKVIQQSEASEDYCGFSA